MEHNVKLFCWCWGVWKERSANILIASISWEIATTIDSFVCEKNPHTMLKCQKRFGYILWNLETIQTVYVTTCCAFTNFQGTTTHFIHDTIWFSSFFKLSDCVRTIPQHHILISGLICRNDFLTKIWLYGEITAADAVEKVPWLVI